MNNSKYNTQDVKKRCENKLDIEFRSSKEFNGWYKYDNKKICRITVSKGRKDLPPKTYQSIAEQLKLSIDNFDRFMDCPLKKDEYDKILGLSK
ncbi:MAG TPA: hypothetical protein PKW56_00150 [Clostridiales bacterium]|nr:hypothetical protein [Clostridiales bacterium]